MLFFTISICLGNPCASFKSGIEISATDAFPANCMDANANANRDRVDRDALALALALQVHPLFLALAFISPLRILHSR